MTNVYRLFQMLTLFYCFRNVTVNFLFNIFDIGKCNMLFTGIQYKRVTKVILKCLLQSSEDIVPVSKGFHIGNLKNMKI